MYIAGHPPTLPIATISDRMLHQPYVLVSPDTPDLARRAPQVVRPPQGGHAATAECCLGGRRAVAAYAGASGDGGDAGEVIIIGAISILSTSTPSPAVLKAICNALGLENMFAESVSTQLAACAVCTATVAVMMTETGLMSRLTAEMATAAPIAMAARIPACVTSL